MLAAAVGVEGPGEGEVGGVDAVDDRAGVVFEGGGPGGRGGLAGEAGPLAIVGEDVEAEVLEAVAGVEAGAAAPDGPVGEAVRDAVGLGFIGGSP